MSLDQPTLEAALSSARSLLLASRCSGDHWEGNLSSSALSTATSAFALALYRRAIPGDGSRHLEQLVDRALDWLVANQNADGGWGDTVDSPSNISTTVLCWCAVKLASESSSAVRLAESRSETWITQAAGGLTSRHLRDCIQSVYGADRTFAIPILTMCALSGRFGDGRQAWRDIVPLPFELAACPHQLFRWLRLSVVSYALPALIAVGQAGHHHRPTRNPLTRLFRLLTRGITLRVLEKIQPDSGGFLEAAPLTSFVLMSLVSIGGGGHPIARRAVNFLESTVRDDGSWPIDTNLATWVTTLSINALSARQPLGRADAGEDHASITRWIHRQQYTVGHPYTHAPPGGWAWTDLSGGVPDADDTAGALLALKHLGDAGGIGMREDDELRLAVTWGVTWLVNLQNSDGGIPTFCRGWGRLPFDKSSPDLTAHALRAFGVWHGSLPGRLERRVERAAKAAVRYLVDVQQEDGSFLPLWFGNQSTPGQTNPVYGTSRVLCVGAIPGLDDAVRSRWKQARVRAIRWLLDAQHVSGSYGSSGQSPGSVEETALGVEALSAVAEGISAKAGASAAGNENLLNEVTDAIRRGVDWLVLETKGGTEFRTAPIGLYFAKLWYWERLYPLIFTVAAWERAGKVVRDHAVHEST